MDFKTKLVRRSNFWYNEGLKRANMRDLTGASISLKRSLKYDHENVSARNLLGLIYFGCGEITEALVQWIISKNQKSHGNIANYYIKMIQEMPNELEAYNQAFQKFNQCLVYCKQNGEDLAIIQLKKITSMHKTYLKAYQLLALLYLTTKQYAEARRTLGQARKLDKTNPITLSYMHELALASRKARAHIKKEAGAEQAITYNLGNETIIQPTDVASKEKAKVRKILNAVIVAVLGVAIIWFLIVPAIRQSEAFQTNKNIVAYSDEIAAQRAEINALKKELQSYRSVSESAESMQETAESTQISYEMLAQVAEQYASGSVSHAEMAENLLQINEASLGETGAWQYQELKNSIYPLILEREYPEGQEKYAQGAYEEAILVFERVIAMQEHYADGWAMLYLANAYHHHGQTEQAEQTYTRIVQTFPDTDVANLATEALQGVIPEI
jgi:Uncharacterized protein conserved in bacteria